MLIKHHIDGNIQNNSLNNLEISAASGNSLLSPEDIQKCILPDTSPLHKKAIELVGLNYIILSIKEKEVINNLKLINSKEKQNSIFYLDSKLNVISVDDLKNHYFVYVVKGTQIDDHD